MGKFLLGLLTGAVLIILIFVIGVFAVASFRSKPPAVADGSTLILHLSGDVPEKEPVDLAIPFLQQRTPLTVQNVWSMLRRAAADSRIKAVIFEPQGVGIGWARMQELRADLEQFRKSGKPLYAYLKGQPSTREYYMATAASKIYMSPTDVLDVKGVAFELMYFKNTFDKLGVQMEVEHAGKYKDFGDMFVRDSMSPETKEVMNSVIDDVYGDLVNTVAKGRNKSADDVRAIIDDGPFTAKQAKARGLVDELRYEDQVFGEMKDALHQTGLKKVAEQDYAGVTDAAAGLGAAKENIAFVVGEGDITRGDPESTDGTGIQSESFDKMLTRIGNDSSVKAVIVRINSGGGDSTASDEMWRAMNELRKRKPTVISMSDAAASGGYFMAMTGDPIVAYSETETGSIGVVFAMPNLHGLYDKVGVTKDYVSRGRFALSESDYHTLTPVERDKLRMMIDSDYEDFVSKVAAARKKPFDAIQTVAQGRVWMGDQAKANGLVDELGGIDRAIEIAKKKAGIPVTDRVGLVIYPPRRSVLDYLWRTDQDAGADAVLSRLGVGHLRPWLRGGMLRVMPFSIQIK
jgi:protease-4